MLKKSGVHNRHMVKKINFCHFTELLSDKRQFRKKEQFTRKNKDSPKKLNATCNETGY